MGIRGIENQEIAIPKQSLRLPPVGIFVEIASAEERKRPTVPGNNKKENPPQQGRGLLKATPPQTFDFAQSRGGG